MEILAQFGNLGSGGTAACSLYGLVMLLVTVWTALNLERPNKEDL
ncbi:MAG: hypothetical protein PHU44_11105 [Syntrophales bacterium]|nr:hypothetical protein [Syntrophales bacterium]MDD5641644.1 hypothetical protein [Syntrophales bacterium]